MADATREEAIKWACDNGCDMIKPVYPPPEGWFWAEFSGEGISLKLTPVFTNSDDADILAKDLILEYAKRMAAGRNKKRHDPHDDEHLYGGNVC